MRKSGSRIERRRSRSLFAINPRTRGPRDTDFTQQRIHAWNPLVPAIHAALYAFGLGLFFAGIGLLLYITSENITEFEVDYTGKETSSPCYRCAKTYNRTSTTAPCTCSVAFTLEHPFEGNVYVYYGLSSFFQNHRQYLKSRDDAQLNGDPWALKNPSSKCEPYRRDTTGLPIAPCGAISNSLFNDTLKLYRVDSTGNRTALPLVKKDIAWWSDKHLKHKNPTGDKNLSRVFEGTSKPQNWRKPVYELDPADPGNNGFVNEDLMVWMRPAMLPTFRKLYRIIPERLDGPTLPQGTYLLDVTYNFPVTSFGGRKRVVLSTMSWMGGKNPFLGLAYMVMGGLLSVFAVVLLLLHLACATSSRRRTEAMLLVKSH